MTRFRPGIYRYLAIGLVILGTVLGTSTVLANNAVPASARSRGLNAAGPHLASDDSRNSVKASAASEIQLHTLLITTATDGHGVFSTPHGLTVTPGVGGDKIRAMMVSVLSKQGNWHTLEFSNTVNNRFWWNGQVVAGVIASPDFYNRTVQVVVFAESV